jgi:hypothetical protein
VKDYRKTNPIKNAPPDLTTLDERKKKKYLSKRERSDKILAGEGVETFETGDKVIHKGHSQNIDNPDVKIKPSNIIYTPQKINQSMSGEGPRKERIGPYSGLDNKIDVAENKIREIKLNKNLSESEKKKLLKIQDDKLMKYVALSDGYKTVTLSDGNLYGEIFQKSKSMDMMDMFPDMTEKETKKFVNKYFTDEGKLKEKWTKGNVSDVDKANIQKSYVFLQNIKNAKNNAKKVIADVDKEFKKFGITLNNDQVNKAKTFLRNAMNKGQDVFKFIPNKFIRKGGGTAAAAIDYALFHYLFGVPNTEALIAAGGWLKGLDKAPLQKAIQSTSAIAGMQEESAPQTFRELVGLPGPYKEDDVVMAERMKSADNFMNEATGVQKYIQLKSE